MKKQKTNQKGITLIALVITIIILLILAGVTISLTVGQNGILKHATNAAIQTEIAQLREQLELCKGPVLINNQGYFDKDQYFEEVERQGIINDKTKDVVDNGDGTYDVTTEKGYVFLVELLPTKENPRDIKISYIGEVGKLPPKIRAIKTTSNKVSKRIKTVVDVVRLEDGDLSYYYREVVDEDENKSEEELEYILVKENSKDLETIITNLEDGKIYKIKVVARNKYGENTLIVKEAIQQLVKEIKINKTSAIMAKDTNLQLTVTAILPDTAEDKDVEWISSDPTIATVSDNGLVTALKNGDVTITVKAKDGGDAKASCNITIKIPVTGIALNKDAAKVNPGKNITLIATISPSNATNKKVKWSTSNSNIATVSQDGVVTGINIGNVIITAASEDDLTKTASCSVEVTEESDWELLNKIAKQISNSGTSSSSETATVTVEGQSYTVNVGDIYKVKYNGEIRQVRVLGFKQDELVNKNAYGGNNNFAGISFDFVDMMTTITSDQMRNTTTNWAEIQGRKTLNGYKTGDEVQSGKIGGLGNNLSNKEYIKQVKKVYIPTYNVANTSTCNDYLWLLSCSEIWYPGEAVIGSAYPVTADGVQYPYYKKVTKGITGSKENPALVKRDRNNDDRAWSLRTPRSTFENQIMEVGYTGMADCIGGKPTYDISPGFCI